MLRNKLHDWLKCGSAQRTYFLLTQMSIKTSNSDHRLKKSSLASFPLYECQVVEMMRFLKYYES